MPAERQLHDLMDAYERSLYAYVLALTRDPEMAADCSQEAFVRAYQLLQDGRSVNRQWLYTVARNCAMDVFRRRRKVRPDEAALERTTVEESTDRCLILQQTLRRLPPLDREMLHLFGVMGFKTSEIAEMLGITGSAARQRLHRARGRFRAAYAAEACL
jgi:RNA polymerase sigma-70 factor (ECF subfamily)